MNGYPLPSNPWTNQNDLQPTTNGYQPLQFYNRSHVVPSQNQHDVPYESHPSSNLHPGVSRFDANGDVDFQPALSSTQRPSQHRHHVKSVPGKITMPHPIPSSSSPDFLLSGHSRTASGEFQPLLPDPDVDSESSSPTHHDGFDFKPLQADPKPNRPRSVINHDNQANQQRQRELLQQRVLLEQEHAWLRQKLSEQEELLALKQAQLTETELLYLKTGDQSGSISHAYPYLHKHRTLDVNPPPIRRHPYGVLPAAKDDHISTNFPPEEFDELRQSKLLTGSMYELRVGHMAGHHSHRSGTWSSASSTSGTPRRKGRRRSHDKRKQSHRRKSFDLPERAPSRSESPGYYHHHSDGYASFHSASKSKRKHGGR